MSSRPSEPSRLKAGTAFVRESRLGAWIKRFLGLPTPGCSLGLVWTPVWLVVPCPGSKAKR